MGRFKQGLDQIVEDGEKNFAGSPRWGVVLQPHPGAVARVRLMELPWSVQVHYMYLTGKGTHSRACLADDQGTICPYCQKLGSPKVRGIANVVVKEIKSDNQYEQWDTPCVRLMDESATFWQELNEQLIVEAEKQFPTLYEKASALVRKSIASGKDISESTRQKLAQKGLEITSKNEVRINPLSVDLRLQRTANRSGGKKWFLTVMNVSGYDISGFEPIPLDTILPEEDEATAKANATIAVDPYANRGKGRKDVPANAPDTSDISDVDELDIDEAEVEEPVPELPAEELPDEELDIDEDIDVDDADVELELDEE